MISRWVNDWVVVYITSEMQWIWCENIARHRYAIQRCQNRMRWWSVRIPRASYMESRKSVLAYLLCDAYSWMKRACNFNFFLNLLRKLMYEKHKSANARTRRAISLWIGYSLVTHLRAWCNYGEPNTLLFITWMREGVIRDMACMQKRWHPRANNKFTRSVDRWGG